jgi:hypothetical protein
MRHVLACLFVVACGNVTVVNVDAPPVEADATLCVPETDAAFCARLAGCDPTPAMDNCGVARTVDCGLCSGNNVCVANQCRATQCASLAFPNMIQVAAINADGLQDAPQAVSADGASVLNQRRNCATSFTTLLIETTGGTPMTFDLSANPAFAQTRHTAEGMLTMSGDALAVIGVNAAGTGFLAATRTATGQSSFTTAAPGAFAAISVTSPAIVVHPLITQDGLAFYYVVRNDPVTANNGIYESIRTTTSAAFPAGTRMPGDIQTLHYLAGMSGDRMTVFGQIDFGMHVLTRRSLRQPFTNPNAPAAAPTVPGFRTRPIGNCANLLGTCTGGCNNEQTCVFSM